MTFNLFQCKLSRFGKALVAATAFLSLEAGGLAAERLEWGPLWATKPVSYAGPDESGAAGCACGVDCNGCAGCAGCCDRGTVFGGVDLLLIRPSFSQATAFARGTQSLTSYNTAAESIDFEYDLAGRGYVGYGFAGSDLAIAFSYFNVSADAENSGTVGGLGEFIVDPFGNVVGGVAVIDPSDARFGNIIIGGDYIETRTTVDLNVFDIDLMAPLRFNNPYYTLAWSAGVRLADLNQTYASSVFSGGSLLTYGDYEVDFFGVGPHIGFQGYRHMLDGRFSLFAKTNASMLVGSYDVTFQNTLPPFFGAQQDESTTRVVPVLESELGVMVPVRDNLQVSAGWLFQSWWDLGASGGTFGGFHTGPDDANIMAFDGLFLRAELSY